MDGSDVIVEVVVTGAMTGAVTRTIVVVVVMVMMMRMVPIVVVPSPMIAVPIVWTIPVIIIIPGIVIAVVVGVTVAEVSVWIVDPTPGVAYINIGAAAGAVSSGIIVVIVIQGGAGASAETLDACRKVGIVVGFGGGVDHAVGVGHRLGGLINGLRVGYVVLAVGVVSLVVVSGACSAWCDGTAVAAILHVAAVVGRIVSVVISRFLA